MTVEELKTLSEAAITEITRLKKELEEAQEDAEKANKEAEAANGIVVFYQQKLECLLVKLPTYISEVTGNQKVEKPKVEKPKECARRGKS